MFGKYLFPFSISTCFCSKTEAAGDTVLFFKKIRITSLEEYFHIFHHFQLHKMSNTHRSRQNIVMNPQVQQLATQSQSCFTYFLFSSSSCIILKQIISFHS